MKKSFLLAVMGLMVISSSLWGQTTSITISGQSQWESTGVNITTEAVVTIEASGEWCGAPWSCYGPEGVGGTPPSAFLAPGLSAGGLVGKVGNNSPFFVGSMCSFNGQDHGTGILYLAFNDDISGYGDNSGTLDVTITMTGEGGNFLVYVTSETYASSFDEDLPAILAEDGHTVTVTDRIDTPEITAALLSGYDQLWIMSTDPYSGSGCFNSAEISAILNFRNAGKGLLIVADDGLPGHDYTGDANQVSTQLGVTFSGQYDYGPYAQPFEPDFSVHPLFDGVQTIVCTENAAILGVNSPSEVVATYQGTNMIAALDDGNGRAVFDVSFMRFWDEDESSGYIPYITVGNTPQYVKNIASWLSEDGQQQWTGEVRGHVMTYSHDQIAGADVELYLLDQLVDKHTTGADGYFSFSGIPAGGYHLFTKASGFINSVDDADMTQTNSPQVVDVFMEALPLPIGPQLEILEGWAERSDGTRDVLTQGESATLYLRVKNTGDRTIQQMSYESPVISIWEVDDWEYNPSRVQTRDKPGGKDYIYNQIEVFAQFDGLLPNQELTISIPFRPMNLAAFTDHLKVEINPDVNMLPCDPVEWQVSVSPSLNTYLNCLGTLMFAFTHNKITPQDAQEIVAAGAVALDLLQSAQILMYKIWDDVESGNENNVTEDLAKVMIKLSKIAFILGKEVDAAFVLGFTGVIITEIIEQDGCGVLIPWAKKVTSDVFDFLANDNELLELGMAVLFPPIWIMTKCPTEIEIVNSKGEGLFISSDSVLYNHIDSSLALKLGEFKAALLQSNESYDVKIYSYDIGSFDLSILLRSEDTLLRTISYVNVSCIEGSRFNMMDISTGNDVWEMNVDRDGDGIYESIEYIDYETLVNRSMTNTIVTANISSNSGGVAGVSVDLINSTGDAIMSSMTDSQGKCHFAGVAIGDYAMSIVTPLGYSIDDEYKPIRLLRNMTINSFYRLQTQSSFCEQRTSSYWRHQIHKALQDKPEDYTMAEFSEFLGLIVQHFNENQMNPVQLYSVPQLVDQNDSLLALRNILNPRCDDDGDDGDSLAALNNARAELITLMLNVVSGKLHQAGIISEDSMKVSQAITYCWWLLSDSISCTDLSALYNEEDDNDDEDDNSFCNYTLAKKILKTINRGRVVGTGLIPSDVIFIAYKELETEKEPNLPTKFALHQNYPNPFNPVTEINFALPSASDVKLEVFNTLGQKVTTLTDRIFEAGYHTIEWDASDVASGVYLYRLKAGEFVETKRMVLLK